MDLEQTPNTRQLKKELVKYYQKVLAGRLDELDGLVTLIRSVFQKVETGARGIIEDDKTQSINRLQDLYNAYNQAFKEEVHNKFAERAPGVYLFDHTSLLTGISTVVDQFPALEDCIQGRERFYKQKGDGLFIKIVKPFKRALFNISVLPIRAGNTFRKIFKRKERPVNYWKYKLPLKGLIAYWFEYRLMKLLIEHFNVFMYAHNGILHDLIVLENRMNQRLFSGIQNLNHETALNIRDLSADLDILEKGISDLRKTNSTSAGTVVSECEKQFVADLDKAGTFELPAVKFSEKKRTSRLRAVQNLLNKTSGDWYNSVFLAYRDWNMDLDIYNLAINILKEKTGAQQIISDIINSKLIPGLNNIETAVGELRSQINTAGGDIEKIRKALLKVKMRIQADLEIRWINTLSATLLELDFPGLVNALDARIRKLLDQLAPEFWLIKKDAIKGPVREADFSVFSPFELLEFESIPVIERELGKVRVLIIQLMEKTRNQIEALPKILVFNLETSYEALEGDEQQVRQGLGLIDEAFERVLNKLVDLHTNFDEFKTVIHEKTDEVIGQFNKRIVLLADNDNALEVRLRLTKAKALRRTVELKDQMRGRGLQLLKAFVGMVKEYWEKTMYFIRPWQKKVGFTSATDSIASEVSDFLLYSSQAIDRLPLVYRKLYSIQPLISNELFVGRSAEISKLQFALSNWEQQRVASSVVIGEKWSGLTSLINHFLSLHKEKYRSIRLKPSTTFFSERQFLQMWCEPLQADTIVSSEELISVLKNLPGRVIIVVEDIQNLYLRRVGGFENLRLMSRIISATSKNIYWLCSCTTYAWSYLDQVIDLSGHFGYVVQLEDMRPGVITDIILKRNNISGYRIKYLPSEKVVQHKKFTKLNTTEQQQLLQEQFFIKLNEFARSNISLALLYWLLSTKDVSEDSLQIGSFESPDFSFMDHMSLSKTLGVFQVVLHDGLSAEHFASVLDMDSESTELLLNQLIEDGILIEKSGHYMVNVLLYRPAINMLKTKNLIY